MSAPASVAVEAPRSISRHRVWLEERNSILRYLDANADGRPENEHAHAPMHARLTVLEYLMFVTPAANPEEAVARLTYVACISTEGFEPNADLAQAVVDEAAAYFGIDASRAIAEPPAIDWSAALSEYQALRAYSDGLPPGHKDEDRAVDRYCEAMDRLLVTAAPDGKAVAMKIALIRERDCEPVDQWFDALTVDVLAIGGAA